MKKTRRRYDRDFKISVLAELWISLPRCYEPLSKGKVDSRALQKLLK